MNSADDFIAMSLLWSMFGFHGACHLLLLRFFSTPIHDTLDWHHIVGSSYRHHSPLLSSTTYPTPTSPHATLKVRSMGSKHPVDKWVS
jgi:hypothetical protein